MPFAIDGNSLSFGSFLDQDQLRDQDRLHGLQPDVRLHLSLQTLAWIASLPLTSIAVAGAYVADAWEKVGLTAIVCGQ